MSQNENKHCGSCRFFESAGPIPGCQRGEQYGQCRCHPPTLVTIGSLHRSEWPTVKELDWCGDWENGVPQG